MSNIEVTFEYPVPDEQYHQTNLKEKRGRMKYIGPAYVHAWVSTSTNKIKTFTDSEQAELMLNGHMPYPTNIDMYLVKIDASVDTEIAAINGGVTGQAIPDKEETIPGQTRKYVSDAFPTPALAYSLTEIEYDPIAKSFVKPLPWGKSRITWEADVLPARDRFLIASDRAVTADLPTALYDSVVAHKAYLRNITEVQGVAWTATIPAGGSGYAVGDVLLVQDPAYKNTTVVDEVKLTVTTISGSGAITGFSVKNKRALYHPAAAVYTECFFVTNGTGTGATVTLTKVKQVDPWKFNWDWNPIVPAFVPPPDEVIPKASDSNPDHLVDVDDDRENVVYTHVANHPQYIDVSDLID